MDFKEQVKASVDIVSVVGEYVRLKRVGSTQSYTGLCPFHNEKTPSFRVHSNHQFYKCFGCGQGGDVFKFVMEIERLSFFEALKLVAEKQGIPLPKRTEYADEDTKLRAAVFQMHEIAAEAFRANLRSNIGADARAYLVKRGVSPEQMDRFGLGYASTNLLRSLQGHGFTVDQLDASGLILKSQDGRSYDRFRNRLMFPIHNESGKVIAFGGRALSPEDEPKYLNSSETPIYRKSYVLYNLHRAKDAIRKEERSVLVEGYMDAIGVFSAGVQEVVASCGTALTSQQVQALKRHAGHIVVNFDPDAAGANAAEKSIHLLLEEGMKVRIAELDEDLDPDEYCKTRGTEAYRDRLRRAPWYFFWRADRARAKFGADTTEQRIAGLNSLLPYVQQLPDDIERAAVATDLAEYLRVPEGMVRDNFRKTALARRERKIETPLEPVRAVETILLLLILHNPEARERILPELKESGATEQFATRRIFAAILALYDSGSPLGFAEIEARLEDRDRERFAAIVLKDETDPSLLTLEQGEACLRMLRQRSREEELSHLRARIKEAERSGNLAEAIALARQVDQWRDR